MPTTKINNAREYILKRWSMFKEKHPSGYDKKAGYGWSWCKCFEDQYKKDQLYFEDSQYVWCDMREEDVNGGGEEYSEFRYSVFIWFNPDTWKFEATLDGIPNAPSYYDFDRFDGYDGNTYEDFVKALDALDSGEGFKEFGKENKGIPHYMNGFKQFCKIIKDMPEKFR